MAAKEYSLVLDLVDSAEVRSDEPSRGSAKAADRFRSDDLPLAIDLDGTVIATDLLWESLRLLLKKNPCALLRLPFWLLRGRAFLKQEVARRVTLDAKNLPYNEEFLEFLRQERARGRILILTTASDRSLARTVADHLGIFTDVLASDGERNLKGAVKRKVLQERFGERGFDYAGNSRADLEIWPHSHAAILVNAAERVVQEAESTARVTGRFIQKRKRFAALLRALRVRHWIKNSLVFVPLCAAQELEKYDLVLKALYAFAAFSLVASSVYVFNDLCDLDHDRRHHQKRQRPFASGALSIADGLVLNLVLLVAAGSVCLLLPAEFFWILGAYVILNVAYSLYLKRVLLLDVIMLAIFYSLRVIAGGVATEIVASDWLLVFSTFIFLSLAFAKRVSELQTLRANHQDQSGGRGYLETDLEQLASCLANPASA